MRPERQAADELWMRRALALARRGEGLTRPNPPVGAVVVAGRRIVGAGYHRRAGGPHAEVYALRQAGARARGATLYVTLEPCSTWGRTPPCVKAITAAGVRRVVVAVRDPNPRHLGRGLRFLRRAGVQVTEGVGAEAGEALLRPFAKWVTTGRPYVTLKLAMTLDGRIADARGRSRWITGEAARRWVHARRARSDAVLVGRETVRRDDPSLLATGEGRRAGYRVVVDTAGAVAPRARVVSDGSASRTILATTARCPARRARQYERRGVRVWRLPTQGGRVSLKSLFARLGDMGLLSVMCEGGAELAAGLVRAGLVDEYVFFVAPRILGGRGSTPAVTGKGWALRGAPRLRFAECVPVGADVMLRAFPASRGGSGRRA